MTCKKAQGFLEQHAIPVKSVTDATKQKQGHVEALRLARSAANIMIAKGKKIVCFNLEKDTPDDDTLLAHLLGPTGNLRAPTLRVGDSLLVGFNEETYQNLLVNRNSKHDRQLPT
jgi:arsenate reductase-like glutaredoxin family protein